MTDTSPGASGYRRALGEAGTATILATAAVVAVVRFGAAERWAWWLVPAIWVAGAVVPTAARRRPWGEIGWTPGRPRHDWRPLALAGGVILCALALGALLAARWGLALPLRPQVEPGRWPAWVLYQLLYVSLPEELFFRGYVQGRLAQAMDKAGVTRWAPVLLAAGLFALAHVAVFGGALHLLVFLPAILFGWLRLRTGSVLPAALAHAAANIGYALA